MSSASVTRTQAELLQTDDARHAEVSCCVPASEPAEPTQEAAMEEEDGDSHTEMRPPTALWPQHRRRSKSDTFGFRSKVLHRLRLARSGKNNQERLAPFPQ